MAAEQNHEIFQTPPNATRTEKRVKKDNTLTFTVALGENVDGSFEEVDDCLKDPSWRKTPMGKWLLKKKSRTTQKCKSHLRKKCLLIELFFLVSSNDSQVTSLKRTSDGGCMCQRSNCSGRCGCRKLGKSCSSGCRCSFDLCQNKGGIENEVKNILIDEIT